VSEWSDGDITLEDMEVQGLFINICAYYWSNNCEVTLTKTKKKFKGFDPLFDLLLSSEVMKVESDFLVINFLDEQNGERLDKSKQSSMAGKASALARKALKDQKVNGKLTPVEITLNGNSTIKKKEEKKKKEEIQTWFIDWFNSSMKKMKGSGKFKLTDKIKSALHQRLKEGYSGKSFVKAIDSISKDDFHKGNNFKHITPEFITRVDKLEMWSNVDGKENNNSEPQIKISSWGKGK
jgi:flagellar basal body-associated protein FliL